MFTVTAGAPMPFAKGYDLPEPQIAPRAILAMTAGFERSRIEETLASVGWSVLVLDDGWALLEHLAAVRRSRGAWPAPALAVVEIAVSGPRLAELFQRLRGLYLDLPMLLVGSDQGTGARAILRPPFRAHRVIAAVRRAIGAR